MRDEILALLEAGAHTADELAVWLNADKLTVIRTLKQLRIEGLTWRTDPPGGVTRWSLAGTRGAGKQPDRPMKAEKKAKPLVKPGAEPTGDSWWLNKSRDELSAAAKQEQLRMSRSKLAHSVNQRGGLA